MKKIAGIILAAFVFVPAVWADSLVGGKEALTLLGDMRRHFSKRSYSILLLERLDRQPPYLEPVDAILFNSGGGSFKKIQTRDRDHRLILNSPAGGAGETLTPEFWDRLIGLIKRNHMVPYVLKDENGQEQMVAFVDPYNTCTATRTPKGILVSVEAHPSFRQRTLEENSIWFRKF